MDKQKKNLFITSYYSINISFTILQFFSYIICFYFLDDFINYSLCNYNKSTSFLKNTQKLQYLCRESNKNKKSFLSVSAEKAKNFCFVKECTQKRNYLNDINSNRLFKQVNISIAKCW